MSRLSQELDAVFPRWRIPRRIGRRAGLPADIRVVIDDDTSISVPRVDPGYPYSAKDGALQLRLRREGRTIRVSCDIRGIKGIGRWAVNFFGRRATILARLLHEADPRIDGFDANVSDFCSAGIVGFCSHEPDAILVPDPDFFNSRGYAPLRQLAASARPWRDREDRIIWRGTTHGFGKIADKTMSGDDPGLLPRTRLCLLLKEVPRADAAFVRVGQSSNRRLDEAWLRRAGLIGRRVPVAEWARQRFAIDIDGNTNAWSNLFGRLLLGCCVIKVASAGGFRQWYYADLVAWRHYVPVKPDMSDLVEKVAWCRDHPAECEAIAAEGQALALSMTVERELARGIATVERALLGEGA